MDHWAEIDVSQNQSIARFADAQVRVTNIVLGYFVNPAATEQFFNVGGWFMRAMWRSWEAPWASFVRGDHNLYRSHIYIEFDVFPVTASGKVLKRGMVEMVRTDALSPTPVRFRAPDAPFSKGA